MAKNNSTSVFDWLSLPFADLSKWIGESNRIVADTNAQRARK